MLALICSGVAVYSKGKIPDQQVSNTVNINFPGYTIEQHGNILQREKNALRLDLKRLYRSEKKGLSAKIHLQEKRLEAIQNQLVNLKGSYRQRIEFLQNLIKDMRTFRGVVDKQSLSEAVAALRQGDSATADDLFKRIQQQTQSTIEIAAKATFERGKIAEDKVDYRQAYEHFTRAVALVPDNPEYLEFAGEMSGTVGNYQQQIEWNNRALAIYLKDNGRNSQNVARIRNNLGGA